MGKKIIRSLIFLILGLAVLYWVYYQQNTAYIEECALKGTSQADCSLLRKLWQDFKSANFLLLIIPILLYFLSCVVRALRWHMLLKPLGITPKLYNSTGSILISYLANLVFPRAGEFVRAANLAKTENVSSTKIFGTIITDRIVDFICLLIVFGLTLLVSYDTLGKYLEEHLNLSRFKGAHITPMQLVILAALGLGTVFVFKKYWPKIKENALVTKVLHVLTNLGQGVKSISQLENLPLFLLYSVSIWVIYFLMLYFSFLAFAPTSHLNLEATLVVFVFGSLGIIFPSPGGMGSYHFFVQESLSMYGVHGSDAFSFANIVFFSMQIIGVVIFGLLAIILLPRWNRGVGSTGLFSDEL